MFLHVLINEALMLALQMDRLFLAERLSGCSLLPVAPIGLLHAEAKLGQEMTQEARSRRYLISTTTCSGDMLGALVSVVNCELVDVLDTITSQAPLPLRLRWEELWREHQQRRFQKRLINRDKRYKRLVHSAKRNPPPPPSTPPHSTPIFLTVKDMGGKSLHHHYDVEFKIKKKTPLWKLKEAYCERLGLQDSQVVLTVAFSSKYFGPIGPDDNAVKVGLEDGAFIAAFIDSCSGSNDDVFLE